MPRECSIAAWNVMLHNLDMAGILGKAAKHETVRGNGKRTRGIPVAARVFSPKQRVFRKHCVLEPAAHPR